MLCRSYKLYRPLGRTHLCGFRRSGQADLNVIDVQYVCSGWRKIVRSEHFVCCGGDGLAVQQLFLSYILLCRVDLVPEGAASDRLGPGGGGPRPPIARFGQPQPLLGELYKAFSDIGVFCDVKRRLSGAGHGAYVGSVL